MNRDFIFCGSVAYKSKRITSAQYIKSFPFEPKTFILDISRNENDEIIFLDEEKLKEVYNYYEEIF
jgi:hypothetical protein